MPEYFMYILILFRCFNNIITNSNVLKVKIFLIKKKKVNYTAVFSHRMHLVYCIIQHQISENILQVYTGKAFY